jgi:hypothetical protein
MGYEFVTLSINKLLDYFSIELVDFAIILRFSFLH